MTRSERRFATWAIAAIALFFLVTRLGLVWRFPLFYDEAFYALRVVDGFESAEHRFDSLLSGDEPLFAWLGMVLMWVGLGVWDAVRFVSVASGLATLVLCGLIGRDLGGWRVGLASAGLAAVVPFFVVHDVIGISDPLATTLFAAALYLQIRLVRMQRVADALLLGLVLGCGLLTKPTTYAAIALLPVGLLLFDLDAAARGRRLLSWAGNVALSLVLAYALYSIMKLSSLWDTYVQSKELLGASAGEPAHSIEVGLQSPGKWIEQNWPEYRSVLGAYLTPSFVLAATVGAALQLRDRPRVGATLLAWALAPIAVALLLTEAAYPRYVLVATPAILVLAGFGLVGAYDWIVSRRLRPQVRRAAVASLALVALAPALVFDGRVWASPRTASYPGLDDTQYVTGGAALAPLEEVAKDLRERAAAGPLTVALGDFTSDYLQVELRNEPNLRLVRVLDPDACSALLGLETLVELPRRPEGLSWRRVTEYARPRDGVPTTLYESGVLHDLTFAASPDELRAAIGGNDAEFDAFVGERPCVGQWLAAWHTANG